jgi:hypothetical protein
VSLVKQTRDTNQEKDEFVSSDKKTRDKIRKNEPIMSIDIKQIRLGTLI